MLGRGSLSILSRHNLPPKAATRINVLATILCFFGVWYLSLYFISVTDKSRLTGTPAEIDWPWILFIALGTFFCFLVLFYTLPKPMGLAKLADRPLAFARKHEPGQSA